MIKVIVVEDEQEEFRQLEESLLRFASANDVNFKISWFSNGEDFLENYTEADLIIMDVNLPHSNGLKIARELRKVDSKVALIFITNIMKYAIRGYEVKALDYILKPVNYARLSSLLKEVLSEIDKNKESVIWVKVNDGLRKLYTNSIQYITIKEHFLEYYTETEQFYAWGTLKQIQNELPDKFVRCNHACIVNFDYITSINNNEINIADGKATVLLSREKKKEFLKKFSLYIGKR
ncbi:MAG: response regulator transcription factor [Clostridia bacterium]|nr:response regulator transcription factor [Clostridia bacterium]